ncbi:conserved hypothetical protein [Nitrosococcus halophilus Nc 4]|uniref:CRISPR-associated protein Cas6 C-terminal domain-containing protein n=1 Tax=Nitrosococcus halophilus (strain Nc4) TaxID=472759 RepID=D5BXY1_NITHN|nr:CRISPR system precrRNA processing endoribonuclease RAMP protein Cas6 [Nitrosococcus halophilus]ADE15892.1 conserved hypothetical protein [Nitrosococcus halophilus Nc 4]
MVKAISQEGQQPGESLPRLPLAGYRLIFSMPEATVLPAYAGSAWRGVLGRALKQTVCVARGTPCGECMLARSCVYPYIFETPPPPDSRKMRRYNAAPHPFVLVLEENSTASTRYTLGLTLFGRGNRYLPYFIHAFIRAGEQGIGPRRQNFQLLEVQQRENLSPDRWLTIFQPDKKLTPWPERMPPIPPLPEAVQIHFQTPLRLKREGRNVRPQDFFFADLFGNLLRRFSMLTYFHTDTPLEADFAGLMAKARTVKCRHGDLYWKDWTRYSSRQRTTMQMGGLQGTVVLEGAQIAPFWPYLWLGQWTHAGKNTSMGLGRYRLEAAASLPERTLKTP